MAEAFEAKIRKVGDSYGLLIPKATLKSLGARPGEVVRVTVTKRKALEELLKLRGSLKGAGPFVRDREDRVDRF